MVCQHTRLSPGCVRAGETGTGCSSSGFDRAGWGLWIRARAIR
jgi:hypothetical protein